MSITEREAAEGGGSGEDYYPWKCRHCGAEFQAEVAPGISSGVSFCPACGADEIGVKEEP